MAPNALRGWGTTAAAAVCLAAIVAYAARSRSTADNKREPGTVGFFASTKQTSPVGAPLQTRSVRMRKLAPAYDAEERQVAEMMVHLSFA
ncbi:uncharacterized protein EV422DRAFT_534278 [Fimicolochytrium jonesii]|uniref:uncharacterized protein n=1 Tax=Fimicolochytrium jonesii TaxID=1396493 RepID=UPI0022FEB564|nr:uncharacterized protein EV422DRAFT_534278 [Fimicolochytrium jonesii]KAI8819301.1 hypothetical protein EV422DRAFT_534278 [Fimicolochytrium jonesii]